MFMYRYTDVWKNKSRITTKCGNAVSMSKTIIHISTWSVTRFPELSLSFRITASAFRDIFITGETTENFLLITVSSLNPSMDK